MLTGCARLAPVFGFQSYSSSCLMCHRYLYNNALTSLNPGVFDDMKSVAWMYVAVGCGVANRNGFAPVPAENHVATYM